MASHRSKTISSARLYRYFTPAVDMVQGGIYALGKRIPLMRSGHSTMRFRGGTVLFPKDELVRFARELYPHPLLGDAPYERAVAELIDCARHDSALAQVLLDGIRDGLLDSAQGGEASMKLAEGSVFFSELRDRIGWSLYDDHEVWEFIGYPGSSYEFGGYLNRGFNDLDWLPAVRVEESHDVLVEIGPLAGGGRAGRP
jgi:hypothetical protein